jgi:polysaccharide deacetylase family protein (PEP-CTERM system associated)
MLHAFSVDVEDYYQVLNFARKLPRSEWAAMPSRVENNTRRILDLLDSHGVKGTFFVLGCVAQKHPELVREIATRGHELASHGMSHTAITQLSPEEFFEEAQHSRLLLENISGTAVRGFRAPSFSITRKTWWALETLLRAGYSWDSSIFPVRHPDYGVVDAPRDIHVACRLDGQELMEFPLASARVLGCNLPVSGGGYFRLLPYAVTRFGLNRVARERPFVFYLHPWEVDPEQPDLRRYASRTGALRHYTGLRHTLSRLDRLLREFQFTTVSAILATRVVPRLSRT